MQPPSELDCYATLDVDPQASLLTIKSAWRRKCLITHSDKDRMNPNADSAFCKVSRAGLACEA